MDFDYEKLCDFYGGIYATIFKEIDVFYPNTYEGLTVRYSEEYLKAYGYLQRAGWRLEEVRDMKKYYKDDDFRFFGLENLYNVRNRIEHYLKNTNVEFSDSVYEYDKYDECFEKFKTERLSLEASEKFAFYEIKLSQQSEYDYIFNTLTMLSDDVKRTISDIKESKHIKNVHNKKLNKINKIIKELYGDLKNEM